MRLKWSLWQNLTACLVAGAMLAVLVEIVRSGWGFYGIVIAVIVFVILMAPAAIPWLVDKWLKKRE